MSKILSPSARVFPNFLKLLKQKYQPKGAGTQKVKNRSSTEPGRIPAHKDTHSEIPAIPASAVLGCCVWHCAS